MLKRKSLIALSAMLLSFTLRSEIHSYHPDAVMRMGKTFDSRNPFEDKSRAGCIEWKNAKIGVEELTDPVIPNSISFNSTEVTSRSDLFEKLNISSSISAKFTFMKGSANFEQEKGLKFDDKSLTYVISGAKVFFKEYMEGDLKLARAGRKALRAAKKARDISLFYDLCGDEIVTGRVKGTTISLVYNFRTSTTERANKLKASLDAKFKSADISFNLSSEMKSVDSKSVVDIFAVQTGTNNANPEIIKLLETEPGNLKEIKRIMAESLRNITHEGSPYLTMSTMKLANLPKVKKVFPESDFSEQARIDNEVERLRDTYYVVKQRIDTVRGMLTRYNPNDFNPNSVERLNSLLEDLKQHEDLIWEAAQECVRAKKFSSCENEVRPPNPFTPSDYLNGHVSFLGWSKSTSASHAPRPHWYASINYWPMIKFRNLETIDLITFKKNNEVLARLSYDQVVAVNQNSNSMQGYYNPSIGNVYQWCWEADSDAHCDAVAKGAAIGTAISRESGNRYSVEIHTTDGKIMNVSVPTFTN